MRISFFSIFLSLILLTACNPEQNDPCAVEFDQLALLSNVADNIISPAYDELKTEVDLLATKIDSLCANPNNTNLTNAQDQWKIAAIAWQKAMIFEFGPAANYQLREHLNNFPVFVSRLESSVQSGNYNLEVDSFAFTRGFPALDYLLFGLAADNNGIVAAYDTDADAANRRQFLQDVVGQIKQKVDWVHTDWQSYASTFKSTEGVATGSPMSLLVNQLNQNYELFKNNKLGTPVGAKVSYIAAPEKVEAYYSRYSLELALASINASKDLFNGKTGVGLDDYVATANVDKDGLPLQELINTQFDAAINALEALQPATLYDAIQNDFENAKTAYAEAQNQVVYLKTDLPSVLCISITYIDNTDDGD
jgi:predicted lipoprotein